MRYKPESQPLTQAEYEAIDKKALIAAQKKEKAKLLLQEARKRQQEIEEKLNQDITKVNSHITDAHIKGSKSHPEIPTIRKKGDAKKLRRKRLKQLSRL